MSTVLLDAEVLVGLAEGRTIESSSRLGEEHGAGEGVATRQPFDVSLDLRDDVGVAEQRGRRVGTGGGADAQAANPSGWRFLEHEGEAGPLLGTRGLHEGDELVGAARVHPLELELTEVGADRGQSGDAHRGSRHARARRHEVLVHEPAERDGVARVHRAQELERHALLRGSGGLLASAPGRVSEHQREHQQELPGHPK